MFEGLRMWRVALVLLVVSGVIGAAVIDLGIGIGYLLRALIPGLEIGMAIVAGAVFAIGILGLFGRVIRAFQEKADDLNVEAPFADDSFIAVPRNWLLPPPSGGKKKRRKLKSARL